MKLNRLALLAIAAALAVIAIGGATASSPTPRNYPPAELQSRATAPPTFLDGKGGTAPRVSIEKVRAEAQVARPTSIVEGQLPNANPKPAVGAAAVGPAAVNVQYCWEHAPRLRWGTWPQNQDIWDHTYWCAIYGSHITYRHSWVELGTDFCSSSGAYGYRVSGGVNWSWVENRSGGHFACPIAPWINRHFHRWMHISRNSWGNWQYTAWQQ